MQPGVFEARTEGNRILELGGVTTGSPPCHAVAGTATLMPSQNAAAGGMGVSTSFSGVPGVTSVALPQS